MFEIKHLRTLTTLAETGNIRKAAELLFVSQSALSHQLKDLEQRLNAQLFIRNTSPVQFTAQGQLLLTLANDILPKIAKTVRELKNEKEEVLQLNLAITCHACFQWLLPVTEQFSIRQSNIKIEFIEQDFANQHNQTKSTPVDLLFTDEKIENDGFTYHALGSFEVVAVLAKQKLTSEKWENKTFLSADDFSQHVLLTYPIKFEELDIFKLFLNNNKQNKSLKNKSVQSEKLKKKVPLLKPSLIKPKVIKQVANSHMILQMVAANMGITTLPDWLVSSLTKQSLVQTKRIGETGIYKTLYARYQADSTLADVIKQLIPHTVIAFEHLYNNQ